MCIWDNCYQTGIIFAYGAAPIGKLVPTDSTTFDFFPTELNL